MLRSVLVLMLLAAMPARAADIMVLAPGTMGPGLKALGDSWSAETGNSVKFTLGTVGGAKTNALGAMPADLVVLPVDEFRDIGGKLKNGPATPLGWARFGLAVKKGAPRPDISTLAKFIAVLKASSGLLYADPAGGSYSGARAEAMLKRPDFSGVNPLPKTGSPASRVAAGDGDFGAGVLSEEINVPGVEVAGPFPKELAMDIHYEAAVLAKSGTPDVATAFLRYLARPEAAQAWKTSGIDPAN